MNTVRQIRFPKQADPLELATHAELVVVAIAARKLCDSFAAGAGEDTVMALRDLSVAIGQAEN